EKGRFTDSGRPRLQVFFGPFCVKLRVALGGLLAAALTLTASPLAAQAPGEHSAVPAPACDRECLIGFVRDHMQALAARDPSQLNLANNVCFTEYNLFIPVDDGVGAPETPVDEAGLEAADPSAGNAAWFG